MNKNPERMKKIFLLVLLFVLSLSANFAQKLNYVQGQLLVKPHANVDMQQWATRWAIFEGKKTNFRIKEQISQPMNIWLVEFDYTNISEFKLLDAIRKDSAIEIAQLNHRLELRSTLPDDPQINLQWQYLNVGQSGGLPGADLDIDLAWDLTTGGLSAAGDTIVVCVIDDGLNQDHPDFAGNIWVNHEEIPGNGIDDDGNGFTDDRRGWNTARNNDEIYDQANHGTPVAAIIGARGNNGIGVSGVNWNVKMMIVKGGIGVESEAIEAYSYPLSLRRLYNQTNGQKGAFVVATNSSWGASYLFPDDAPLWCAMYDSLGNQGILNAGATANLGVNVDEVGDLPSTCPSDYLIAVTNINDENLLIQDAAYGEKSVDLAAYGDGVWTVDPPTGYGTFNGTSAATPHVAGAIALLYSAPCPGFAALYKSDPKAAALLVRQFILEGTIFTPTTQLLTVTEGRLNINNSLQLLMNACSSCFPPTSLAATDVTDTQARLLWNINSNIQQVDLRWRAVGAAEWKEVTNVVSPFELNDLLACTEYEFQLKGICPSEELKYSNSFVFRTDGCCEAPTGLQVSFIGNTIATFRWDAVLGAQRYTLRLRPEDAPEWRTFSATGTSVVVNNLMPCTRYEVQLNTVCNGEPSEFGEPFFAQTPGCGACKDLAYCEPSILNSSEEWITQVKLGTLQNNSGANGGYGNFTGMEAPQLVQGNRYELELRPGFSGIPYTEHFSVWIDFDQNGIFDNAEKIYDKGGNLAVFSDSILIPTNAKPGITRLRVAMQFLNPGGPCSFDNNSGGEVEDYCVQIMDRTTSTENDLMREAAIRLYPNPFREQLRVALQLNQSQRQVQMLVFNSVGQRVQTIVFENAQAGENTFDLNLSGLPAGVYWLQCQLDGGVQLMKKVVKIIH